MPVSRASGHGHDDKYSAWRRSYFEDNLQRRDLYCTDIDWIEWRNGNPVAIIECRRAIGKIRTAEAAIDHVKTNNNGFQLEVLARLAHDLEISAYIVGIEEGTTEDYSNARFLVARIDPLDPWPTGRVNLAQITTSVVGSMNQVAYADFIANL